MVEPILTINKDCYCLPMNRAAIIADIVSVNAAPDMKQMLGERANYFANTSVLLSPAIIDDMQAQISAIETAVRLPAFIDAVSKRSAGLNPDMKTRGVFMGYDFHITDDGPRLIEINSNAGGAFIVDRIEHAGGLSFGAFAGDIADMFRAEWASAGRKAQLKTIAIVDENPAGQYHYPDMCLAQSVLKTEGFAVIITGPEALTVHDGGLYHGETHIDLVYNRLTDFDLSEPQNSAIRAAYDTGAAVITPAPHHHAIYADKRNLIMLSDPEVMAGLGAQSRDIEILSRIPKTRELTPDNADDLWTMRKQLFFKPKDGFGGRGAFRGAKITKSVWAGITKGGYIAQAMIAPPYRAVTVDGAPISLKFDVRVYTYDGRPLLFAARVYQGQTTNLRTQGGGLAAVISTGKLTGC